MKRITVIMPDEVYDKVIALAKKERRSKSAICALLIEDGLKVGVIEIKGEDLVSAMNRENLSR